MILWKEIRDLTPYLVFSVFLLAVALIVAIFNQTDRLSLEETYHLLGFSNWYALSVWLLFCIALGTGICNREREIGTLPFIDGLPISRSALFSYKILATWLVLMVFPYA